ncbi:MAG: penicillin acylase family protein [Proteobacteria bacterium]|jgi:penicillin G amidase|nr:penicillin acylase family protein [Pseudomonadota bacterium]MDA1299824.1 penicillin acylase family protein [Pseudomonadota bacterium]
MKIPGAEGPISLIWDKVGIPHIFAQSVADAYRGLGYACASERLWQIHLSNLYATGRAAGVLGERFVTQDLMHRAFNVRAFDEPDSPGDWIADAYIDGVNGWIAGLDAIPGEFVKAGTVPTPLTRHDIASRYRFTGWFQHKTWLEKIYTGKLMARHGIDWFHGSLRRFSDADRDSITELSDALLAIDPGVARLLIPDEPSLTGSNSHGNDGGNTSGSNNWAISAALSASGAPMLATDPHQPHSIPNTFFYAHLNVPGWDVFGATFPGMPYFMMGLTTNLAWGLTTGFVDTYDVFIERDAPVQSSTYEIDIAGQSSRQFSVEVSRHGPILESLTDALGFTSGRQRQYVTSLDWVMRDLPTSAGALALLPLARNAGEFGEALFENDVSPLVNNIICVDRHDGHHRYIAATLRQRRNVTGTVPLAGWRDEYLFDTSRAHQLLVEKNPDCGFSLTANNDTMGDAGPYPIHNFPTDPARADRIRQLLVEHDGPFTVQDFCDMQLDLVDLRARRLVPDLIAALTSDTEEVRTARALLSDWDCRATTDSAAACIYYPLADRRWHLRLLRTVLGDDPLFASMSAAAPGLSRFTIADLMTMDSPWLAHRETINTIICEEVTRIVTWLRQHCGTRWRWGDLHQIGFRHSLAKYDTWSHMSVGPDPVGGSPNTLAMAMHLGAGQGSLVQNVFHGPAFRWVVDLADPLHFPFIIAGGNGGRPDSPYLTNHYQQWLTGQYVPMTLVRHELDVADEITLSP